ncbi:chemotaxis protein CheW, partial [Vibrio artabrorum]
MSVNNELTETRQSLSSEQALDDYFTSLLGEENSEPDAFFVDQSIELPQPEEPEPEPE